MSRATWHEERVRLAERSTRIRLGPGVRALLGEALQALAPRAERIGWLIDAEVARLWERSQGLEPPGGYGVLRLVLPAGEAAKEREVLAVAQDLLLDLRREEPVVVLGGGAALDLGGFAAATAHRGHPWVALPTTVLAMADASVGGKVAINHARGKNLLGTFHPPAEVLADLDLLTTLPAREAAAGWAEVRKAGHVGDPALLQQLERGIPTVGAAQAEALARALAVKARLVEQDERDLGPRRLLNFGHTLGHAFERACKGLLHGEAVALGMLAAIQIAVARGRVDEASLARERAALGALGLPLRLPGACDPAQVLELLGADKKRAVGALHTFILPRREGGLEVVADVRTEEVERALAASR